MFFRVAEEQGKGEAAIEEDWEELRAEFARLTAEMDQAIADAIYECEQILSRARDSQEGSIADSTSDLYDFIDARLAAWGAQANQERNNAEWQEDSYYRYNLIRLLQAKQQAIDDAVAEVKARWGEAMSGERAEG